MRKTFICLMLIMLTLIIFAEENDRVTIVFVSQPGVDLYINGSFAITVGPSGSASFSFSLGNTYNIYAESDCYIQVGEPFITTSNLGETIVFINVKPAAWLGVISNTYPLDIFVDKVYYGSIESEDDMVKVPAGIHDVIVSSKGYEDEKVNLTLSWKEKKYIKVTLKKAKPEFYIILPYSTFSPNGDWYRDYLDIKIYASQPATATVLIKNPEGKVYMKDQIHLDFGINELKWDGKNAPDGKYILEVNYINLIQEREISLTRENYTYRKEITLTTIALLSAAILTLLYLSK
ncbi:MAG: hypothetical protein J7L34_09070 [Thermotogaceae bacterium]|nr:hypothetical protein [Thermotogaceae bacterium]